VVECFVELEERLGVVVDGDECVVERDRAMCTAALLGDPTSCTIDENVSHRDGRDTQKVRAILPVRSSRMRKLEIELVNERRRGQRVAWSRGKLTARGATKLVIHERKDLVECFTAARA